MGHLQRCLSLAEALRRSGLVTLFLAQEWADVRSRIGAAGFECLPSVQDGSGLDSSEDPYRVTEVALRYGCDCTVLDSYRIDSRYVSEIREAGLTVCVDDLAAGQFAAHLVVNGAAGANGLVYRSSTGDTQFLLGTDYVLLNSAFWNAPARIPSACVKNVLVCVGGADPRRALPQILRAMDALPEAFSITAVVGPFASNDPDLVPGRYRHDVSFVHAPSDLRKLMYAADMAVSASGQTLYELVATGTPSVAVRLFDNQATNIRGLAAEGVVVDGGDASDVDFGARLCGLVADLISDGVKRERISRCGQALIDGLGPTRVAEAMLRLP